MKKSLKRLLIFGFASQIIFGQNHTDVLRYSILGQGVGTRALGMGNAYIGVSDDYTATYWNPAGLAQLKRLEFTGGVKNFSYKNKSKYLNQSSSETISSTAMDNFGFVFPFPTIQGSLVFAFGYNRYGNFASGVMFNGFNEEASLISSLKPSDGKLKYHIPYQVFLTDTLGNTIIAKNVGQEGQVKESGNIGEWSFSSSIDLAENISIGASLNVVTGSYSYNKKFIERDSRNLYLNVSPTLSADSAYLRFNTFIYDNIVESEINGTGLKFGFMYRSDFFRVGTMIRTPYSIEIQDVNIEKGQSFFDPTGGWKNISPDSVYSFTTTYDYKISTPWSFGIGASWYVLTDLLLSVDADYTDWSQVSWENSSNSNELNLEVLQLQSLFHPTLNVRVGAEYYVPGTDLRLRGGYVNNPTKYKNLSSNYDEKILTGGVGYFLQRDIVIESALAIGNKTNGNLQYNNSSSLTTETVTTTSLNFSLSYRF